MVKLKIEPSKKIKHLGSPTQRFEKWKGSKGGHLITEILLFQVKAEGLR